MDRHTVAEVYVPVFNAVQGGHGHHVLRLCQEPFDVRREAGTQIVLRQPEHLVLRFDVSQSATLVACQIAGDRRTRFFGERLAGQGVHPLGSAGFVGHEVVEAHVD